MLDSIIGQNRGVKALAAMAHSRRVPSSLIFTGPAGVGRALAGRAFAYTLSCEHGTGCGACAACKANDFGEGYRVIDIAAIFEDDDQDSKVRALKKILATHSQTHRLRHLLVVITNAARMNEQMQAAMLKTIEEPPKGVSYVFIVESALDLTATIRSRSMVVKFAPLAISDLRAILRLDAKSEARLTSTDGLLAYAGGSLECATKLLEYGSIEDLVKKVFFTPIPKGTKRTEILERLSVAVPAVALYRPQWKSALIELDRAITANAHVSLAFNVFRHEAV